MSRSRRCLLQGVLHKGKIPKQKYEEGGGTFAQRGYIFRSLRYYFSRKKKVSWFVWYTSKSILSLMLSLNPDHSGIYWCDHRWCCKALVERIWCYTKTDVHCYWHCLWHGLSRIHSGTMHIICWQFENAVKWYYVSYSRNISLNTRAHSGVLATKIKINLVFVKLD